MAIEKVLNTRIQLKYDSYANWSAKNPTLKSGEVAIAYLTTSEVIQPGSSDAQHPVMFKVGPGAFNSLPWASALAADVHAWAKKSESEFTTWVKGLVAPTDIGAYTKGEVDNLLSSNSSADQKYAKDYADGLAKNYDPAGKAQELINALDVTDAAVAGKYVSAVSETDGKISVTRADLPTYTLVTGSANGTVAFNGADVAVKGLGSAAYKADTAFDAAGTGASEAASALETAKQYTDDLYYGAVSDNTQAIADIKNGTVLDSFADVEASFGDPTSLKTEHKETAVGAINELYDDIESTKTIVIPVTSYDEPISMSGEEILQAMANGQEVILTTLTGIYRCTFGTWDGATAVFSNIVDDDDEGLNLEYRELRVGSNKKVVARTVDLATKEDADGALAEAKKYTDEVKKAILGEGITETFDTLVEIEQWIKGDGVNATELSSAIAGEAQRAKDEEARIEGLVTAEVSRATGKEAELSANIKKNTDAIAALNAADGKVANAGHADEASSLDASGVAQVKGIKVDNAANADSLGGVAAADWLKKSEAVGYNDILTKTAAAAAYQPKGDYASASQGEKADTAVQSASFAGTAFTKNGTALSISQADARTALGLGSAAYTEANAYATAAQGAKADSALQEITTTENGGLKVTNKNQIDIDTNVVFVFNCGSASELVD